ncbi:arginase family protein [Amycolatopsis aidingensis]|uniref:arginase family protein n=1 Tax=Amycolatopsis aidingensis TaxID=2842453 RepID=UPI001C0BCDAF|nr:arginase family protein [Amycolatopsis aidingensis]
MHGIDLLAVPYDSGRRGERMGAGPGQLIERGALDRLGPAAGQHTIEVEEPFAGEIRSAVLLQRSVSERVRANAAAGRAPLVLAGNCNTTVGAVAGLTGPADDLGVVWFDAHGDFNTPETSDSGFLDGMALAMLTGDCWRPLTATVPGFRPVPERQVVLAGARALDAAERERIERSGLHLVPPDEVHGAGLAAALRALPRSVTRVHLHIDLDVHDSETTGPANQYAVPGGPDAAAVREAVAAVGAAYPVVGATLSAFDPAADALARQLPVALALVEQTGALLKAGDGGL